MTERSRPSQPQAPTRPELRQWKYALGAGLAFALGGMAGHGLFLLWCRWYYGSEPIRGYVESFTRPDGSRDLLAFALPFLVRFGLVCGIGLAVFAIYRRTLGKRFTANGNQERTEIPGQQS